MPPTPRRSKLPISWSENAGRFWRLLKSISRISSSRRVDCGKESRPALNRRPADAKRRRFDTVPVYSYDRFARSRRQLVNELAEFGALGIHFVGLHEGVDTSTPNGRPVFGIFASIAEFELELIRGKLRSGLAAAKARGNRIGGRPNSDVDVARIAQTARGQRLLPRDSADSQRQCENSAAFCRKTRSRSPASAS